MDARVTWFGSVLVALVPCAVLASGGAASAQDELTGATSAPLGDGRQSLLTLEGLVLAPDGSPAEGAVVVSSAGGKALTDAGGRYRFEVEVPLEATSVQVTASSGAGRNLSASVALSGATGWIRVDPLTLSLGSSCSTGWLPTFGGQPGVNGTIEDMVVHDDGHGPAFFIGGTFTAAGGVAANQIAKWDGTSWSSLGGGMSSCPSSVFVLERFGSSPVQS